MVTAVDAYVLPQTIYTAPFNNYPMFGLQNHYNRTLTTTERTNLNAYLYSLWGV
jgi:hypothetical protein